SRSAWALASASSRALLSADCDGAATAGLGDGAIELKSSVSPPPAAGFGAGLGGVAAGLGGGGGALKELKSRAPPPPPDAGFAAGLAAGFGGGLGAAVAAPAETSRTKPSLSSFVISDSNAASKGLPTFCATSASVARPSMAESTARSARWRRLVFPAASCTPLPDFE